MAVGGAPELFSKRRRMVCIFIFVLHRASKVWRGGGETHFACLSMEHQRCFPEVEMVCIIICTASGI